MASSRRRLIGGKRERECTLISNNNEIISITTCLTRSEGSSGGGGGGSGNGVVCMQLRVVRMRQYCGTAYYAPQEASLLQYLHIYLTHDFQWYGL